MPEESELRKHQCCFTGHRPEKLNESEPKVVFLLKTEIEKAIDDGFVTFISGMARGVDIWAAEIVLKMKEEGKPVHLICAIPYDGFDKTLSDDWKILYKKILESADDIQFICQHYSRSCFQLRNIWMVDKSARIIAAYTGEPGGTRNTIQYAEKKNVEIRNIFE